MLFGACWIVMFRLKSKALIGIGGGICGAFAAIQVGGYANQILMQFPNVLLFYGSLAVVYTLPLIEKEYDKYEEEQQENDTEKDLFLYRNMEESVFTDSFVFSLYFFCYEKTEPLDVHLYAFGFCFSILRHSATRSLLFDCYV